MAELLGPRKRGRKKEQLRLAVTQLAATLKPAKGEQTVTVEVAPAKTPKGKAEVVTFEIPKGSAIVPVELTRPKNDANAREQIRLGLKDAEKAAAISSVQVRTDDGEEFAIFIVAAK
jgi:hypothetical protein